WPADGAFGQPRGLDGLGGHCRDRLRRRGRLLREFRGFDGAEHRCAHAAAFTGANVLVSTIRSVALTLPLRPSSNFTCVSTNCSVLPLYSASVSTWYFSAMKPRLT